VLLLRRGVLARQMGDKAGALRWLQQAALRAPEDGEVHSNLGNALADVGDPAARAIHLRAAQLAPAHPGVQLNCAGYLATSNDPAPAIPMLEAILAKAPNDAMAWGLLGDARRALGDDAGAAQATAWGPSPRRRRRSAPRWRCGRTIRPPSPIWASPCWARPRRWPCMNGPSPWIPPC
jgi:predicted Zn-dependent protease